MSKLLKICGMTKPEQIREVVEKISPDFIGFIFYPKSPRYMGENFNMPELTGNKTKKTGVFVNESLEKVLEIAGRFRLEYIQLHGDESPSFVKDLNANGLKVIKAFRVDMDFDMDSTKPFEGLCDFFLFDAKVKGYGGGGISFDWKILEKYKGNTSWLLSGGLNTNNMKETVHFSFNHFAGFDVNSGFELTPGVKNIELLKNIYREGLLK